MREICAFDNAPTKSNCLVSMIGYRLVKHHSEASMSQRNDSPPDQQLPDDNGGQSEQRAEGHDVRRIEAPRLVPAQGESRERISAGGIVTVPFEEAAHEAGYSEPEADAPAAAVYERARRFIPLAAAIAIAAAVGALTGAITTAGLSRLADDSSATAALREDGRRLEGAMTKIGRDLAALKTNVDASAKTATTQMARLSDRLEKTDKAQADATTKVAKLADAVDRNTATTAATATAAATKPASPAAADPTVTGSIPTAVPPVPALPARAQPPVVDGWVLRSVQNGTALIQGRIGLVEVEPGDSLPGLGRIENIRRQDGRWVVVTSRGLIVMR
jgi:hypothetical protein